MDLHVLCCDLLSFMLSNLMCFECLEQGSQVNKESTVSESVLQLILIYLDWSALCDSMAAHSATAGFRTRRRLDQLRPT